MKDIYEITKEIGLTRYETAAYLSLLAKNGQTASQISSSANIPQSRIYSVLKGLISKGWIEKIPSRPTRYKAYQPQIVGKKVAEELKLKAEETAELLKENLIKYQKGIITMDEKPEILILYGLKEITVNALKLIHDANREIFISSPEAIDDQEKSLIFSLKAAIARKVKVKILTASSDKEILDMKRMGAEISFKDQLFGGGVISDRMRTLLVLPRTKYIDEPVGILSSHVGLSLIASEYFEHSW